MRLALFLLLAASAAAQPTRPGPVDPDSTLGDVTVTAGRIRALAHRVPARVTTLDQGDVAATGAATVADVLEDRSAVFLKRYGPDGLASISLRGSGASHTLVLLDGHRISDPQLGQIDPSLLPSVLLERAEVVHGPASALYGTDAVGGVVAIETPDVTGRPVYRLRTGLGAFDERTVSGLVGGRIAGTPLAATFAADLSTSRNDYLYVDSTAFDAATGTTGVTRPRENTDVRRGALFGTLGLDAGRHEARVGLLATDAERGLFDYAAAQAARQSDGALRVWADHAVRLGAVRLVTGAAVQRAALRYQNPSLGVDDEGRTRLATIQSRLERTHAVAAGVWTATLGGSLGHGVAGHPKLAQDARETTGAAFAQVVADYGRLLASGSLRLDRATAASADSAGAVGAVSPQLGLNVQPTPWPGLRLKGSVGRSFRTPTFNDRFWSPGGNPALRPERGWTAEAGASLAATAGRARVSAEATAFTSRLDDQIVWRYARFADGSYWAPLNVGQTRTMGWEASATVRVGTARAFAEAGGLWTRALARDRSDPESTSFGQPLLYVPDDQGKAHVALGWRALRLDLQVRHAGRRYVQSDGGASLAPYTVADAQVGVRLAALGGEGRLSVRLDNLTDARYAVTPRFPMPPRHLRLALTLGTL